MPGSPVTAMASMRNTAMRYFTTESGKKTLEQPLKNYLQPAKNPIANINSQNVADEIN